MDTEKSARIIFFFSGKLSLHKILNGRHFKFKVNIFSHYLGAYLIFRKLKNNYFLHAGLWRKQVTFLLFFFKYNKKLLNNTK